MKNILTVLILSLMSAQSYAGKLLCASKSGETLYFTDGQVRVTADIDSATELSGFEITVSESDTLGVSERSVSGKDTGKYIRFEAVADAWCNYKFTVGSQYLKDKSTNAFLDASCEENNGYSISLKCKVID